MTSNTLSILLMVLAFKLSLILYIPTQATTLVMVLTDLMVQITATRMEERKAITLLGTA